MPPCFQASSFARMLPAIYCLLLVGPLFLSPPLFRASGEGIARPLIFVGDEPHYLVYANSLWRDGDFDLFNNYRAAAHGGPQAGLRFAGQALQHHSVYYIEGEYLLWSDIFFARKKTGGADEEDRVENLVKRPAAARVVADRPEYSLHPPGLPIVLVALLRPFGGPDLLESGALFLSAAMIVIALFIFRLILGLFSKSRMENDVIMGLVFLGTPVWHYARVLYTESFTLCLLLGAVFLFLREEDGRGFLNRFSSGALLGMALLVKPASVLFCIPLGLDLLFRRRFGELAALALAPCAAGLFLLYLNDTMFGSPWLGAQKIRWEDPAGGLLGILFSFRHGLLPHAPIILLALVLWPSFYAFQRRLSLLVLGMVLPSLLLVAAWPWWDGGVSYGPRLIVPLIPLICLSLLQFSRSLFSSSVAGRFVAAALCVFSLAINSLGAFEHARHTMVNPLETMVQAMEIVTDGPVRE